MGLSRSLKQPKRCDSNEVATLRRAGDSGRVVRLPVLRKERTAVRSALAQPYVEGSISLLGWGRPCHAREEDVFVLSQPLQDVGARCGLARVNTTICLIATFVVEHRPPWRTLIQHYGAFKMGPVKAVAGLSNPELFEAVSERGSCTRSASIVTHDRNPHTPHRRVKPRPSGPRQFKHFEYRQQLKAPRATSDEFWHPPTNRPRVDPAPALHSGAGGKNRSHVNTSRKAVVGPRVLARTGFPPLPTVMSRLARWPDMKMGSDCVSAGRSPAHCWSG